MSSSSTPPGDAPPTTAPAPVASPLPALDDPQFDNKMRLIEHARRLVEFDQRERHEAAWAARHAADMAQRAAAEVAASTRQQQTLEATRLLTEAQKASAEASRRIIELLEADAQNQPPAPSPAPEPPAPAPSPAPHALRFDALVRLVASMTPEQRADPAAAAEAAMAQLSAIAAKV